MKPLLPNRPLVTACSRSKCVAQNSGLEGLSCFQFRWRNMEKHHAVSRRSRVLYHLHLQHLATHFTMVSQWPHLPLYSNVDFRPKNLKHIMQALEAWTMGMSHGCSLQSIKLSNIIKTLTIWLFNIAMENGPFIDGLPIKNGDFPWLC